MKQMDCEIIQDLLPLYADQVCSAASRAAVEQHVAQCQNCKALLDAMEIPVNLPDPELDGKAVLRRVYQTIAGVLLILFVMAACVAINAGGAWMGGPANPWQFVVTVIYIIFWGLFSIVVRNHQNLAQVSFVISLLTFISAVNSLVWRLLGGGGFIAGFVSIFASVPFYGLRWVLGWTETYVIAVVMALIWLVYAGHHMRKFQTDQPR